MLFWTGLPPFGRNKHISRTTSTETNAKIIVFVSMIRYIHENQYKSQTFQVKKNKNSNCNVLNHNPLHMVHSLFQLSEKEIFLLYVSVSSTAIVLVANLYLY